MVTIFGSVFADAVSFFFVLIRVFMFMIRELEKAAKRGVNLVEEIAGEVLDC